MTEYSIESCTDVSAPKPSEVVREMLLSHQAMPAQPAGGPRKRRNARPFDAAGLAPGVELLEAQAGSMPMTFGLLRPVIFVPADAAGWSEERLRMVLLHELAQLPLIVQSIFLKLLNMQQ